MFSRFLPVAHDGFLYIIVILFFWQGVEERQTDYKKKGPYTRTTFARDPRLTEMDPEELREARESILYELRLNTSS